MEPIDERVVEVLAEASAPTSHDEPKTTTLSSGVVVRHKAVPPMILAKIDEKYVDPPIPMIYFQEKDQKIPNPDDPEYLKAIEKVRMDRGNAAIDIILALGTELVSVPDSLQTPDEDEWIEELEFVGITVPKLKIGRWLAYLKYYAAKSTADIQELAKKGAQALGTTEGEVARSIERFQDSETRQTDPDSPVQVSS